ncbi:hypothetical protein B0J13DRAFT_159120 [Dactylonectria estremocensis]|uniref:Protein HRI1 n=1 Tax=Dactylonectria estremocensis TaxID=1079267 RepID=A0A9P9IJS6_9HYPO|nr:hypothetical protein B0J13DRAFT_159120 [Dactylonectria estremocensis]
MKGQTVERISIRWLPDEAFEDTRTIALNVGGYFIDLRVTKENPSIQWSHAGELTILKEEPFTCRWSHIIDSLGFTDPDEASFTKLPNGDELEVGETKCPHKNDEMTAYEEVWRDVTAHDKPEESSWIMRSSEGNTFIGRVGNIYQANSLSADGFSARREDFGKETKEWNLSFDSGNTASIPRVADVLKELSEKTKWSTGDKVTVGGHEFSIIALEDN